MYDTDGFYSNAGTYAGSLYPDATMEFRKKFVDQFKRYVDAKGGVESFRNASDAVKRFVFETQRKGYRNV